MKLINVQEFPPNASISWCKKVKGAVEVTSVKIADIPKVQIREIGRWNVLHVGSSYLANCSICHWHTGDLYKEMAFCPNCGARMDGEES